MDIQKIQDYLSGKLSAQDSLEVQLFLAEHMDDPEVTRLMDNHFDSCRREAGKNTQGALDSVHKRLGLDRHPLRRTYYWVAAAAAIVLLAIPAAFQAGWKLHREPAPVVWQELSVPMTQTRNLTLPDGTLLTLNAGSRITWPDRFSGANREVFLDGEVVANVAKDSEHPFIIHSGEADIRVHGTTFDLKAYHDASILEIMLREGSVSLHVPSGSGKREVRLSPGDLAQFDKKAGNVAVGRISTESYRDFTEGASFSFINIPLQDIALDLERTFGKRIIVADDSVVDQRFLAFFSNGESLDEILRLLCRNGRLKTVRKGDTIYIYNNKH